MKFYTVLALKNIRRRPLRSAALVLLSALLAFVVFGGSLIVLSLRNGLSGYRERLGADVVAVPSDASIRGDLEAILLQGIPGYFYMNESVLDKITAIEGVETATPQFFLASAKSGCCSVALQVIGFDPATDFTIQPWIAEHFEDGIGFGDCLIGNHVTMPTSHTLTFYNQPLKVVGQLDETGTALDNAVYTGMDTVRALIKDAEALGFQYLGKVPADHAISSVMIKVADGYTTDSVANYINIHVRKVDATKSGSMIASIADGLQSITGIISLLTAVIWIMSSLVLAAAFLLITNERKKEFAVLRAIGASGKMLRRILVTEGCLTALIGAVTGVLLSALIALPFTGLIRNRLHLPYLLPDPSVIVLLLLAAILCAIVTAAVICAFVSGRIARQDAAFLLREAA